MRTVGIMANGPVDHIPELQPYIKEVDCWIGADLGALILGLNGISVNFAVGDFDSVDKHQHKIIMDHTDKFIVYPEEKNETDLEIAIQKAVELKSEKIYLFGVTGGRLDHALINMQLLHRIKAADIRGIIVDKWNKLELTSPGTHEVHKNEQFSYVSFVPFTQHVKKLSLEGFYYPLEGYDISWGSTRCVSNKLVSEKATFTYEEGMLLLIQSCDAVLDQ